MFVDTVIEDKALHKPVFLIYLSVTVLAIFFALNFTNTLFGEFLRPVIGDPTESGFFGRFAVSLVLTLIFVLNLFAISFFKLKAQVAIVWVELFLLFLAFAYSFDLKMSFIQSRVPLMISRGLFTTIYISAISIVIATVIAVIGAIAKLSNNGFAYAISSFYTSLFRGLPLLLQLFLIYKGLPQLGFMVDAVPAAITALSLCYGAYMTEIFRAGIQSIPKGQWEASRALGFKFNLILRKIILPQAIPPMIPPLANYLITMFKETPLLAAITVVELFRAADQYSNSYYTYLEPMTLVGVFFLIVSIPSAMLAMKLEKKFKPIKVTR